MASLLYNTLFQEITKPDTPIPLRVQISGVMGSTSLACWIVLLMPQLIEQWRLKSADGIAIGFISIWFLGDVFNLIGAVWAGLLPEVIFLAIWFCIADFMMIVSYVYYTFFYKKHHHKKHRRRTNSSNDEERPLIRRRSSTLTDIALEPQYHSIFVKYILPILFVLGCGIIGFYLGGSSSSDHDTPDEDTIAVGPQIMGYCSAVLYLGARIPQIIQNYQRKSVYGLSLLFFLFSVLGNLTYAGQILFYRSDSKYIVLNLSWLLGSLGTIFEDSLIFLQFYIYRQNEPVFE
ncbi:putative vacuolar amino acid transporter YPQ3 [Spathaspora sp. JA1]|nr:putative vacuolar amino acid transporter YPQ3 [Spathaspora sp. JA1]